MIKVLVLEPPLVSNVGWWRLWRPLGVIKAAFPQLFQFTFKRKDLDYFDAWNYDIVITARPGSGKTPAEQTAVNQFVEEAKKAGGAKFIVDIDDFVFGIPKGHPLYTEYQKKDRVKAMEECMSLADAFWYSTPAFLETIDKGGQVMPNAIFPEELPKEPTSDKGIAAWRGHSIQIHDLMGAGADVWPEIRDKAQVWFWMGYYPPLKHTETSTELPYVSDPAAYMELIRKTPLNVLWKPMIDCTFNLHKSNIAMIEATMAGGYCLTNFAGRPEWENTSATWLPYKDGVKLWEQARQDIIDNYNLGKWAIARAEHMVSLVPHLLPQKETAQYESDRD